VCWGGGQVWFELIFLSFSSRGTELLDHIEDVENGNFYFYSIYCLILYSIKTGTKFEY
jgi:hypothetical protein